MAAAEREAVVRVDPVTEMVLLAAQVADRATRERLVRRFPPDFFQVDQHRACQAALRELANRQLDYDAATVHRLADAATAAYLEDLRARYPAPALNLDQHCDDFEWDRQRALAATGPIASLLEAVAAPDAARERVRALAHHVGEAFDGGVGVGRYLAKTEELVRANMQDLEHRIAGRAFYSCGIPDLDLYEPDETGARRRRLLPGTSPGTVSALLAVSSGGKSTIAANMTIGIARTRRKVLYGAWEPRAGMTLELLAAISLGWSRVDVLEGRGFTPERKVEFEERQHAIGQYVSFMHNPFRKDDKKRTTERNLEVVREHVEESGCEVFVADLFKRCMVRPKPEDEEEALLEMQAITEDLAVHSVLLHQLRAKDLEQREDSRPTLESTKGSGAWVEVVDQWIGVHRPAMFKSVPDNRLEVLVLKQRWARGQLAVEFDWDAEHGSVTNGRSVEYKRPGERSEVDEFAQPRFGTKRQQQPRHKRREG